MIGRDKERSEVIDTLLHKSPACIAILGGGGMGKTTLAVSVLHEPVVVNQYPSRYFVSCEGVPSVSSLVGEITNALRIPLANHDAHLIDTILSSFPANTLLCLDNLETIWDNEATRSDLEGLLSDLQLRVLGMIITMRGTQRPSRVSWSKPFLPPLQSLTGDSSRSIFEMTCGSVDEFVEKLLGAVDGIPLAISLIGALLQEGNESSKSLWGRWERAQSGVLENGGNDRLSNLDTSIHLSVYGPRMLADPKTIDILAMLSVLPDGFPDDERAMEELESHLPKSYDHRKALLTLRRVSLIHVDEAEVPRRLRMLSPVRSFCEQRLEAPEELRNSITSFYVQKMNQFTDVTDPAGHAIIPGELDNVYAVFIQAWKEGKGSPIVANASIQFTMWSGYVGNPMEEVIGLAIQGVVGLPGLHGTCHLAVGEVYLQRNKLDEAEASFKRAAELHRQVYDVLGEANDVRNLGEVHLRRDKLDEAEASFKRAAELHRQAHDVLGEASDVQKLGEAYLRRDNRDEAEASFKRAAKLHRQARSVLGEANDAGNLGVVYLRQDNLDEASASFKRAAELHRQVHSVIGEANDVGSLGEVYLRRDNLDEAEASFKCAAELHQQVHFVLGEANDVGNLGEVYLRRDKLGEAEASFKCAAELHRQAHSVLGEAYDVHNLGQVYLRRDKLDEAEASFERAAELHRQAHSVLGEAHDIHTLGEVYLRQDKLDKAEASFERAAELQRQAYSVLGERANLVAVST